MIIVQVSLRLAIHLRDNLQEFSNVTIDLDNFTYDVNMTGPGVISGNNVTGIRFDNNVALDTVRFIISDMDVNNMDSDDHLIDDLVIKTGPPVALASSTKVAYIIPDSAAPGMNLAIQFVGRNFRNVTEITTNSSDVIVGPHIITNADGNTVDIGNVTKATFFVNATAANQMVAIFMDGQKIKSHLNITTPDPLSGDFTGQGAGPFILGAGGLRTGTRTLNGTILLSNLIVPAAATVRIDTTDLDPSASGNQGYLPASIVVAGDVDIQGIIDISGQVGANAAGDSGGDGGNGGPGGGGGGGGKSDSSGNPIGGDGGEGFPGGGAGGGGGISA